MGWAVPTLLTTELGTGYLFLTNNIVSSGLQHIVEAVVIAAILGTAGMGLRASRKARERDAAAKARDRARDVKLDRLLILAEGYPGDPITGQAAIVGISEHLARIDEEDREIRDRVVTLETLAHIHDDDFAAIRRIEALLTRHMLDGREVMRVGTLNDRKMIKALREAGVEVEPFDPYPPIDYGHGPEQF
jgi:hypothetical protein